MNLLYVAVLALVSAQIKGVRPQDAEIYRNKGGYFYCLGDPSIKIPYDRVNDDYCDCPDGSDEPGTSACSKSRFWCQNDGYVGAFIPSRFVNDGKCDYDLCCDGSDEAPGLCPNRCAELAEKKRLEEKARKDKLDLGLKAREVFVLKAKELRDSLGAQIETLESELQFKQTQLQEAIINLEKAEQLKDTQVESTVDPLIEMQLNEARMNIKMAYTIIDLLKEKYEQKRIYADQLANVLELMKRDYNPNFNDAAVKQAINSFEDAKGNVNERSDDEGEQILQAPLSGDDVIDSLNLLVASAQAPRAQRSYWQDLGDSVIDWLVKKSILPARRTAAPVAQTNKVQEAEAIVQQIRDEINQLEEKIAHSRSNYETQQGPDDVLRGLEDVCVKQQFGEYEYEICYYKQASQRGNGQFSVLGNHKSYRIVDDHLEFKYTDGAKCWNGPPRSANVIVRCGESNELLKVEEIEKCVYSIDMLSPVACFPEDTQASPESADPVHEDL